MAIEYAAKYKDFLKSFLTDFNTQEYLKFFNARSYASSFELDSSSDWNTISVVSTTGNKVNALFSADVNRDSNIIAGFQIVAIRYGEVTPNISTSVKDCFEFIDFLLNVKKFRKICFACYVGNPAETIYDRIIKKYNGRIVGTQLQHNKLYDGKYYDLKLYEIFPDKEYSKHI